MRCSFLASAAFCWLACGSEGATIVPEGAGTDGPTASAGTGGAPAVAAASSGTGGTSGAAGAPLDAPESDLIGIPAADFSEGEPPVTAGTLPQIISVVGPGAVTNGGTAILHITVSPPVAAPTFVVGLMGDSGYHTVVGSDPDADGVFDISVQIAAEVTQRSLVMSVALRDDMGNVGPYQQVAIALVQSGTGDVKITLSFDRVHDLDLHVIEPSGEEVSFTNDASATGGQLDLDSGSNCEASVANAENVFWPPGGAPPGEYRVTVQNYQQCSAGAIEYTVRIAYDAEVVTAKGSFADGTAGEAVSANNVTEVTRFTRGVVP